MQEVMVVDFKVGLLFQKWGRGRRVEESANHKKPWSACLLKIEAGSAEWQEFYPSTLT
jgi:hypothetical protein